MAAQLTYSTESRTNQGLGYSGPSSSMPPGIRLAAIRQNVGWHTRDLAPGRYTLGSGPDCDIILSEPGVAPRHCTLMIGDRQNVIKAWSPLTWINDGVVHEGALRHGDRLIVGPVELKVSRLNPGEFIPWNSSATAIFDSVQNLNAPHVSLPQTKPASLQASPSIFRKDHLDEILSEIQRSLNEVIEREHIIRDSLHRERQVLSQRASELSEQWKVLELSKSRTLAAPQSDQKVWPQLEQQRQELQQTKIQLDERYRELAERASTVVRMHRAVKSRIQDQRVHHAALEAREASVRNFIARNQAQQRQLTARTADIERRDEALRLQQVEVQGLTAKLTARTRQLEEEHEQRNIKLRSRQKFLDEFEGNVSSRFRDVEAEENRLQKVSQQAVQNHEQLKTSLARLEAHQRELDTATAALTVTRRQLDVDQVMLVAHRNQFEADHAEFLRNRATLLEEQQQHAGLKEQLSARMQDLLTQEQELKQREQELAESLDVHSAHFAELSQAREDLDREQQTLIARTQELDHREAIHAEQVAELERRHGVVASLAELEQQRQELLRQQAEFRQVSEQLQARHAQIEADEHSLATQQESIAHERARYTELQTQLQHVQGRQDALGQLESELDNRSNLLHSREMDAFALAEQTAALEALRLSLARERDELQAHQQVWLSHQTERDDLKAQVSGLQEELRTESRQVAQLREQRSQLEAERHELALKKSTLDELERSLHEQAALRSSPTSASDDNREELVQRETALLERERGLAEKEESLRALQLSLEAGTSTGKTDEDLLSKERQLAETSARLQQQEERIESRQADLDADFQNLARLRNELEAERSRDAYEREQQQHQRLALDQAESALSQARRELAEHQEQFEKQQSEQHFAATLPTVTVEHQASNDLLEQAHQELAKARQEIQDLREQLHVHSAGHDDREVKIQVATEQMQVERERLRSLKELLELRQGVLDEQDQQLTARGEELERARAELAQTQELRLETQAECEQEPTRQSSPVSPEPGSLLSLFMTNKESEHHSSSTDHEVTEEESEEHGAAAMKLRSELASLFGLGSSVSPPRRDQNVPDDVAGKHEESESDLKSPASPEMTTDHRAELTQISADAASAGDEEEESVDAYMRRLLARTRVTTPQAVDPVGTSKPPSAAEVVALSSDPIPETNSPETSLPPAKKARKLEPGEKESIRANLDSFRELANFSARTAVATSKVSRTSALLRIMLVMAGLGWVITGALLTTPFWLTDGFFLETLAVGGITSIMTVLAGIRLWEIKQMAAVPGRQREQSIQAAEAIPRKIAATDDQSKSPLSFL